LWIRDADIRVEFDNVVDFYDWTLEITEQLIRSAASGKDDHVQ
jgi:hypothetical protein